MKQFYCKVYLSPSLYIQQEQFYVGFKIFEICHKQALNKRLTFWSQSFLHANHNCWWKHAILKQSASIKMQIANTLNFNLEYCSNNLIKGWLIRLYFIKIITTTDNLSRIQEECREPWYSNTEQPVNVCSQTSVWSYINSDWFMKQFVFCKKIFSP